MARLKAHDASRMYGHISNGTIWSSQAGLAAIFQSLNMQLFLDVIQQRKLPAAICSNDAKSCYDHIVHGFVALAVL